MTGYGCDDMGIKKHKEKNVMDKKLVRKAMGESDISQGIGNGRQHGQQKEERSSLLPKKTNKNSVPNECRLQGITGDMGWEEKEKRINQNNEAYTRSQYEKMGIKVLGEYDELFYSVELPADWKIQTTSSSIWSDLLDSKGRKRLSFFHKDSVWDRDAFSNFICRYSFSIMPFDNFESDVEYEERVFKPWRLFLMDSGEMIDKLAEVTVNTKKEYFALDDKFRKTARDFLDEHYPEWEDVNAYWD